MLENDGERRGAETIALAEVIYQLVFGIFVSFTFKGAHEGLAVRRHVAGHECDNGEIAQLRGTGSGVASKFIKAEKINQNFEI